MKTIKKTFIIIALFAVCLTGLTVKPVFAEDEYDISSSYSLSPMNQKISLIPGERYYGTFKITNPAENEYSFAYETEVSPFYVDEDYQIIYENNGDYNQIVDWITIENPSGVVVPNSTTIVRFYVDVPENAPAGGQYATIIVRPSDHDESARGVNIKQKYNIAHVIYAEVAGETVRRGEFNSISVPSFLFSGNISGAASIKNVGNVHSDAVYALQIFPLFSSEEVYTNEEDPLVSTIMPEATRTTILTWGETPMVGVYHVIFTAKFEDVVNSVDKYVIVCPLWLLLVILSIIVLIIIKIISKKARKDN